MRQLELALGVLLLAGCGGNADSVEDIGELGEEARDIATGCTWREGPARFAPWEPEACYRVYTGAGSRFTLEPLSNACAAAELSSCVLLHPGAKPFGYFDRDQLDEPRIIRYERSPLCEPCP